MVCTDRLSVGMFQRHSRFRSQYILQLSGNELRSRFNGNTYSAFWNSSFYSGGLLLIFPALIIEPL